MMLTDRVLGALAFLASYYATYFTLMFIIGRVIDWAERRRAIKFGRVIELKGRAKLVRRR